MAKNMTMNDVYRNAVVVSNPTTPASGDPVRYGLMTGVALTAKAGGGNAATYTTVDFGPRGWNLSVKGVNDSGNSAVAVGDALFYVDADTPKISKKSTGYFFGFANAVVGSGLTATIEVFHYPSPGAGTLGSGTVGPTNLAANAVGAAALTTTLATGFISLPIAQARTIASSDIPALAAQGGMVAVDSLPKLIRLNAATDKQLRLLWAATSVIPVTWSFAYPPDLDDTANVIVNVLANMAGATDTPTLAVNYFEGVGDTNAGGNTAAVTGVTVTKYTRTIAASDIGAYPNVGVVEIVPAAHGTDTLSIYGAWLEYTRK